MRIDRGDQLESNIRDRFSPICCPAPLSGGLTRLSSAPLILFHLLRVDARIRLHDLVPRFLYHALDHVSTIFRPQDLFFSKHAFRITGSRLHDPSRRFPPSRRSAEHHSFLPTLILRIRAAGNRPAIAPFVNALFCRKDSGGNVEAGWCRESGSNRHGASSPEGF